MRHLDLISITVVDVTARCLVKIRSTVATWPCPMSGVKSQFQATKSNAKRLECEISLRKEQVPQVIQDAMDFVEAFGEQYLWVDCLFWIYAMAKELLF